MIKCVDTRFVKSSLHAPRTASERLMMRELLGDEAFLMPEGTPRRSLPSFPIASRITGCYTCTMMRMQYTRIGQGLNKPDYPESYKSRLREQREKMINLALEHADPRDNRNACNWAIRASKKIRAGRGRR